MNQYFFRTCFNSTMVRLGEWYLFIRGENKNMFQFHYGSIGSACGVTEMTVYRVSIPLWFDWEPIDPIIFAKQFMFQFHYGSIGRISLRLNEKYLVCFNSTMVRLGARFRLSGL